MRQKKAIAALGKKTASVMDHAPKSDLDFQHYTSELGQLLRANVVGVLGSSMSLKASVEWEDHSQRWEVTLTQNPAISGETRVLPRGLPNNLVDKRNLLAMLDLSLTIDFQPRASPEEIISYVVEHIQPFYKALMAASSAIDGVLFLESEDD
jgi:hypothetical protein